MPYFCPKPASPARAAQHITPAMDQTSLNPMDAAAVLVVLAAVFGYVNYRLIKLPHTIGLTIMGALASLAVVAADALIPGFAPGQAVRAFLRGGVCKEPEIELSV